MGSSGKLLQIIVVISGVVIIFAIVATAAASMAKPGCPSKCGDVEIPFPFGFTEGCYLDKSFNITCDDYSRRPMTATGNVPITNISIHTHQMRVMNLVARDCYQPDGRLVRRNATALKVGSQFTISDKKNTFTVIGCDTIAYLRGYQNGESYKIGCSSECPSLSNVVNGSCSGVGCCEVGFPDGLKDITVEVKSFNNHSKVWSFNPCGYAFVVKKGEFNFSSDYLKKLPNETVPLVLDWGIGFNHGCEKAQNQRNYACKENSECIDRQRIKQGYYCKCKQGYQGNPYLHGHGGCQDIDECGDPSLNNCTNQNQCFNTEGSYKCGCPKWYRGDGRKDGERCYPDFALAVKIPIGIGISLIALLGGSSWLYLILRKRRFIKLKEKFFQQNGGLILERHLKEQVGSTETAKIFTVEELNKATKNYDESRIIGRGGFGTVYKGFLPDNRIVAIKKSKTMDQNQIDQFINEVVLLSQINHRNVVNLMGCCLETEVPLLVYEFVPKGTLLNYIHHESSGSTKRWETYLRIAAETADALSYLHSAASTPIIHRDVKSSNILLDDNFTAKVSDFGISRLLPRHRKELATVVQGTLGYLDPEYLQTNRLTEKSDVYSFGVVLVEILTGDDVLSFDRSEEETSLPMYFLSFLKEDRLFEILENHIVEEGNKEQIKEVVELAERCLKVKGDERPSMMEVAMKLERIRKIETHLWVNAQSNVEEAKHLHSVTYDAYECGGSSSTTIEYDSMNEHVTLALGDGR